MDGPPSSIDIGETTSWGGPPSSSSTSSLTYYERKFGAGDDIDPSSFIPSYTPTDKGETRGEREARGEDEGVQRCEHRAVHRCNFSDAATNKVLIDALFLPFSLNVPRSDAVDRRPSICVVNIAWLVISMCFVDLPKSRAGL